MKRLSHHTIVVLFVLLLSSVGGLSLAVVAFGQDGADPDATVPLGDYTSTTPSTSTAPLSPYTTTTPSTSTAPLSGYTNPTPTQTTESTTTTGGTKTTKPTGGGGTVPGGGGGGSFPSRATRSGPTHLAFTGGEPIVIGAFGVALMGAGLALNARRRRRA
jgi:hypothetical protein